MITVLLLVRILRIRIVLQMGWEVVGPTYALIRFSKLVMVGDILAVARSAQDSLATLKLIVL